MCICVCFVCALQVCVCVCHMSVLSVFSVLSFVCLFVDFWPYFLCPLCVYLFVFVCVTVCLFWVCPLEAAPMSLQCRRTVCVVWLLVCLFVFGVMCDCIALNGCVVCLCCIAGQ